MVSPSESQPESATARDDPAEIEAEAEAEIERDKGEVLPAPAILASTLLALETDHGRHRCHWQTGIKSLDDELPEQLWRGGKVIGLVDGRSGNGGDRGGEKLATDIIATHLARIYSFTATATTSAPSDAALPTPPSPSTFIISPPSTTIVPSINAQLQRSLSLLSSTTRPHDPSVIAVKLLDTVHLLQYFDFAGLADSVSEVSARVHELQSLSSRDGHSHNHNRNDPTTDAKDLHLQSPSATPLLLLINGLDAALGATQRRSGLVQANALAASLFRSIAHLARNTRGEMLLLVGLEGGTAATGRGGGGVRDSGDFTSAFSYTGGAGRAVSSVSPGGVLGRTLLAGMDTVVLVQDMVEEGLESGGVVAEVVKDREGSGLGCWAVWGG